HLQRTRLLLHLVDVSPDQPDANPARDVRAIAAELKKYDERLYKKPRWLVLNKIDRLPPELRDAARTKLTRALRWRGPCYAISALTGEGCRELTYAVMKLLEAQPVEAAA